MSQATKYFAVIGSGVSGASAARLLAEAGHKVDVFEAEGQVGGALHSIRYEDFWLELGGHTCYNSYGGFIDLCEKSGVLKTLIPREKKSFRVIDEEGMHTLASVLKKGQLFFSLPKLLIKKKHGEGLAQYYSDVLGKDNYSAVFKHFFNTVICQDSEDFPAELLFKKRPRNKSVPRHYSLQGGLQSAIESWLDHPNIHVHLDFKVLSLIQNTEGIWALAQREEKYKGVVLGTSVQVSRKILKNSQLIPEVLGGAVDHRTQDDLVDWLGEIPVAQSLAVGVIFKKDQIDLPEIAFMVGRNQQFFSAVSRDVIPHPKYRGLCFHFRDDFSGDPIEVICRVLKCSPEDFLNVSQKENVLPSLKSDHLTWLEKRPSMPEGLVLTGNYFQGMAIEDCVQQSISALKL